MTDQARRASAERRVALAEQVLNGAKRKLSRVSSEPASGRQRDQAVMAARLELGRAEDALRKARRALRDAADPERVEGVA